ncbi:MAG: GNAT family N-acetyltransferase [Dehalococcoidia bacterium]|nr:GNAT family N-acetyltransferase [Dehalococcoidia bacterium]
MRLRVFVEEQGVPAEEERDGYDAQAVHAVAVLDGVVVGTGRLVLLDEGAGKIGRMAVERQLRRRGIGGRILGFLEAEAKRRGLAEAVLHAQTYVQGFYADHGYVAEGDVFLEAGIPHIAMRKRLVGATERARQGKRSRTEAAGAVGSPRDL